jgi:hypothetical protein
LQNESGECTLSLLAHNKQRSVACVRTPSNSVRAACFFTFYGLDGDPDEAAV